MLFDKLTRLGAEDRWFTLDNRRLYCLQKVAVSLWPDRAVAEVCCLPLGPWLKKWGGLGLGTRPRIIKHIGIWMYMARNSKICLFFVGIEPWNHHSTFGSTARCPSVSFSFLCLSLHKLIMPEANGQYFCSFSRIHERGVLCQSITPFKKTLGDRNGMKSVKGQIESGTNGPTWFSLRLTQPAVGLLNGFTLFSFCLVLSTYPAEVYQGDQNAAAEEVPFGLQQNCKFSALKTVKASENP